MFAVNRNWSSI